MKSIIIKQMSIVNFKGIRSLDITFNGLETKIRGANGTGKTTIFDAFTWLLFGKDSKDRTKFNLKTLDERGEPIPQLPHEVSATLDVDGEAISLRRCWTEVWTNRRGSSEKEFSHNEGERYYNDVPCSEKEYKEKIDAICDESRFKELTNPFYFTSQSRDYQRGALLAMVGDLTNEEVAATDPIQFQLLLDRLSGKTLAEFEREVAYHKKRVKSNIADLEPRLDEKKRELSGISPEDWNALEQALNERKSQVDDIDAQIADTSRAYQVASNERHNMAIGIADLQRKHDERQLALKQELLADYRSALAEYQAMCNEIDGYNDERDALKVQQNNLILKARNNKKDAEFWKSDKMRERENLLDEYRRLMASQFDENGAICPTCGRPYEGNKRKELYAIFLANRNAALERNKQKGLAVKKDIEELDAAIARQDAIIAECEQTISSITYKDKGGLVEPTKPNIDTQLADDAESLDIERRIAELKEKMGQDIQPADTSELTSRKRAINEDIMQLVSRLGKREQIAAIERRVSELENALTTNRKELEEDNQLELLIFNFNKARIDLLESRINSMFRYVKFKMYNRLNNGDLTETCECTIDGVPYSDLNSAAKINAGLDIINAISRVCGMCAPIFLDNRESVTQIISTDAQVISLIVDADCDTLDIE